MPENILNAKMDLLKNLHWDFCYDSKSRQSGKGYFVTPKEKPKLLLIVNVLIDFNTIRLNSTLPE